MPSILIFLAFWAAVLSNLSNASILNGIISNFPATCAGMVDGLKNGTDFKNVTVNFATYVPAGTNITFPDGYNLSTCYAQFGQYQVVSKDLCRISMEVSTSNQSEITLEAWLPLNWTGRFLSTGNGGVSGCIQYTDLDYASSMGFAAVGANNGHNGTSGLAFYKNPDVITDFSWRSVYTGVQIGKAITTKFYGSQYTKSYYLGCSTGGRQGLQMAQEFPDIFDGILAGAPAVAFNNLTSWSGYFYTLTGNTTSPTYVPTNMWLGPIHDMILDQCDAIDGIADGIIEDPELCNVRAEALLCAQNQTATTDNCLTESQVQTVNAIFQDYLGTDGKLIYPRMQPGSELLDAFIYYGGTSFSYTDDWFRYAVYNDANWDPSTLTPEDASFAAKKDPGGVQSFNGDLSAFQSHGGKILHYHGQQDNIISSTNSPRYYNHVSDTMDLPSSTIDSFYRFFRVSGMYHCAMGEGAWQIGNVAASAAGTPMNSQNNVLMRIVDWVENGNAPETITGTKFVNDTPSLGVDFVRNHCKYPTRNVCVDPRNYKDPSAWKCV